MAAVHHKFLVHPTTTEFSGWPFVETETAEINSRHRDLRLALDKAERLNIESAATARLRDAVRTVEFPHCGYADDRYPYPCAAPATVADMETGCTFCASHFREVIL